MLEFVATKVLLAPTHVFGKPLSTTREYCTGDNPITTDATYVTAEFDATMAAAAARSCQVDGGAH